MSDPVLTLTSAAGHLFEAGDVVHTSGGAEPGRTYIVTAITSATTLRLGRNTWWRRLWWRLRRLLARCADAVRSLWWRIAP